MSALTITLAAQALGLASLARHNGDRTTSWAAVAFAAVALGHALVTIAPPQALLDGLADPLAAAGALLAVAAATLAVSRVHDEARAILQAAAALVLLYLASVEVVTLAGGGQDGQTLLSVLWALAGVAALVRGLVADDRGLRRGALALLGVDGDQGLPLRPGVADLALPRRLADRARPAAALRRLRLAARPAKGRGNALRALPLAC